MDSQPTPAPVRPDIAALAAAGPIRVIVEPRRSGWFGTLLKWAFMIVLLLFLVSVFQSTLVDQRGLREQWHSLNSTAKEKIAIITVQGVIMGDENFIKQQIDRVRDDDNVKAVVLRIDSPGGTITGSDYIYHYLKKLSREKRIPLVVSMGGIAASGGYYVAMAVGEAENTIFAEPTTWTGSIGVIIPHYDVSQLLEKWEIKDDSIASNPLKMMGSPTRNFPEPIRAEEQMILQELVDSSFAGFKEIVLAARPALRDKKDVQDKVFTGRIFTAAQAQENLLVDRLGFIEDAIDRAIELAALDKDQVQVVKFYRPVGLIEQALFGPRGRKQSLDLQALWELAVPRAYYLASWLPGVGSLAGR